MKSIDTIPDDLVYQAAFACIEDADGTRYGDIWLVSKWDDHWVLLHPAEEMTVLARPGAAITVTFIEV